VCCSRQDDAAPISGFDCRQCELRRWIDSLWCANADAWRIYQALCGRMVSLCSLYGYVIETETKGWTATQVLDLLRRLDLIASILQPSGTKTPSDA